MDLQSICPLRFVARFEMDRLQVRGTAVMGSVSAMVNRRATPARLMTLEEVHGGPEMAKRACCELDKHFNIFQYIYIYLYNILRYPVISYDLLYYWGCFCVFTMGYSDKF